MHHGGRQEHDETRQRRGHDELLPDYTRQEAHERLGEAADANHSARQRILDDAGDAASQHAGPRAGRQRNIDDDDQHQIDGGRATNHEPREGRLQRERQSYRDQDTGDLHL